MNIVVLAGGLSTERDVSLVSGRGVYSALCKRGHKVVLLDVFLGYEGDVDNIFEKDIDWTSKISAISEEAPDLDKVRSMRNGNLREFFGPNVIKICQMSDIVFMALHGDVGENGKIQGAFDLLGIKYTGTDAYSSALAMNKSTSKLAFRSYGVSTPDCYMLKNADDDHKPKFPCVVKICNGGSSVGVYMSSSRKSLNREHASSDLLKVKTGKISDRSCCDRVINHMISRKRNRHLIVTSIGEIRRKF